MPREVWEADEDWFCAECVKGGAGAAHGDQHRGRREDGDHGDDDHDDGAWGEEEVLDAASAAGGAKPPTTSGGGGLRESPAGDTGPPSAESEAIKRRLEQLSQKEGKSVAAKSGASRRTLAQLARKKHGRGRGRGGGRR